MKLLEGLMVLNKDEWLSLKKYVRGFSRVDSDVLLLFDALYKNKRKLDTVGILKTIKSKAFLGSTQKNFLNIQSKLYQLYEDWIVHYDSLEDRFQHQVKLIKSLNKRSLYDHADRIYEDLRNQLDSGSEVDLNVEQKRTSLYHAMYYSDHPIKNRDPDLIIDLVNSFLILNTRQLMVYQAELYSRSDRGVIDAKATIQVIERIISTLPSVDSMYTDLIKLIRDLDAEACKALISRLQCERFDTSSQHFKIVVLYLLNKSAMIMQKGMLKDYDDFLWLINFGYESGAFITEEKIPLWRLTSSISFLCHFHPGGSTSKIFRFIERWSAFIITKNLESSTALCHATAYFYLKDYDKIPPLLSVTNGLGHIDRLTVYSMLLVTYYELRNQGVDRLMNHMENMKKYIRRAKEEIDPPFLSANTSLLEIVEKMVRYPIEKHAIDIASYGNLMYRTWINNELKK